MLLVPISGPVHASEKAEFEEKVPNGDVFECGTCHEGKNKDGHWNAFGEAVDLVVSGQNTARAIDWLALCVLDSDGDGWTNGEELLDPDCVWEVGNQNPGQAASVTHPGDANDFPAENVDPVHDVQASQDSGSEAVPSDIGPADMGGTSDVGTGAQHSGPANAPSLIPAADDDGCASAPSAPAVSLIFLFTVGFWYRRHRLTVQSKTR